MPQTEAAANALARTFTDVLQHLLTLSAVAAILPRGGREKSGLARSDAIRQLTENMMSTLILSPLAVASIRFYQQNLSPLKGFRCANGAESGVKSCSAFGRHVFERYDVTTAAALLRRRFAACRAAYERFKAKSAQRKVDRQTRSCDDGGAIADCACQGASGTCDVGACV